MLKEGYLGQTVRDFLDECIEPETIGRIIIYGNGDDPLFEGTYEDIPEELLDAEFLECEGYTNNGQGVQMTINTDQGEENQSSTYYITVQDFLEDCNSDYISIYDLESEEVIYEGYKDEVPDDIAELIFISYDAPDNLSINLSDYEDSDYYDYDDNDEIEMEVDEDEDVEECVKKSTLVEDELTEDNNFDLTLWLNEIDYNGPRYRGDLYPATNQYAINEEDIPDNMRLKSIDVYGDSDEAEYHYITQQEFDDEDYKQFKNEFLRCLRENIKKDNITTPFKFTLTVECRDGEEYGYVVDNIIFDGNDFVDEDINTDEGNSNDVLKVQINDVTFMLTPEDFSTEVSDEQVKEYSDQLSTDYNGYVLEIPLNDINIDPENDEADLFDWCDNHLADYLSEKSGYVVDHINSYSILNDTDYDYDTLD